MHRFQTLKARLVLICVVLSVALVVVGGTGYLALNRVSKYYSHIADVNLPNAILLLRMSNATGNSIRQMVRLGYPNLPEKEIEVLGEKFSEQVAKYDEADKEYQAVPFVEGEAELYEKVSAGWKASTEIAKKMKELRLQNDIEKYAALLDGDYRKAYNEHGTALQNLIKFQDDQAHLSAARAKEIRASAQNYLILIGILGLFLGLGVAYFVARSLQLGLRTIAAAVSESKETVSNASEQLNAASQQLANSSTEAAASLEETVASLEELTSMVKLNAGNAQQASALAQQSQSSAFKGEQEIETLIAAMAEINQSSKRIEDIINVIDDIAFQTNLLALNAAVEAARAGEQGKGFAVVAEAVRSLAQRSAQAAKEISTLIHESVNSVEKGAAVADRSGSSLKEIVSSVKKVTELNSEIATASGEQSEGIAQISRAMNQLDQATQSNAASAEEAAASSEIMLKQARVLDTQVNNLMNIVG